LFPYVYSFNDNNKKDVREEEMNNNTFLFVKYGTLLLILILTYFALNIGRYKWFNRLVLSNEEYKIYLEHILR
jgi:hypothetical protein